MAELVDALGSGPSGGNTVEVRVLFWAPKMVINDLNVFLTPPAAPLSDNLYQNPVHTILLWIRLV